MLPQSEYESPMITSAAAPVAIAAISQDRALIGLLRSVVDPSNELILVGSETELTPHLNSRRVSVALLDSMFIEGDLGAMAERLRQTWPDLVLVVVGTAEEQAKVTAQITSGVVYRFLHRPVSAPRVRLFVDAALRRHEVENVERTLEQSRPDFSKLEPPKSNTVRKGRGALLAGTAAVAVVAVAGLWYGLSSGGGEAPATATTAQVVSPRAEVAGADSEPAPPEPAAEKAPVVVPEPAPQLIAPAPEAPPRAAATPEKTAEPLRPAASPLVRIPEEVAPRNPPAPQPPTLEQRLREKLAQAETALQRGELASPPARNAVELFRGALELDPGNALAKAGLVRVADRLLSAAERALTAGNTNDARKMVAVAESLTPATMRGAFLTMQIERERERAALTRARDSDALDKLAKGGAYLRLANTRLRSGALIEPSADNARFYLEAARQVIPNDPGVDETSRALQKQLLERAAEAARTGNAAETERWLANADSAGAQRAAMAAIRRALQDTLISARASRTIALAQSFTAALGAHRLLQPAENSAKGYLLALINTDSGSPTVATARQNLGNAYLAEARAALARGDLTAADGWLAEARPIGFTADGLGALTAELAAARDKAAQRGTIVGAKQLERVAYVAPKFPAATRNRGVVGWVELEFTVLPDGSTGDIVVTNASPRGTFDDAAVAAIGQWRYKPTLRDGKPVEQRAAVRIRFSDQ
jgi:TonB family protein